MSSRSLVRRRAGRLCRAVHKLAGSLVGAAVALVSLFAGASSELDGAGLFTLPAERVEATSSSPPPARRRSIPVGDRLVHSFTRTVERAKGLGVAPMILGFEGLGVYFSGRM
jgi:hypothetical protein